jgi:hypothetical protein
VNLVRRVQNLEVLRLMVPVPPEPVPVETPADVVAVLAECVNLVRADVFMDPSEKARTLGMLSSVALRAMEAKDLAARLEAVERVLKLRKEEQADSQKKGRRGF